MSRRAPAFLVALFWASLWGLSGSVAPRVQPLRTNQGPGVDADPSTLLARALVSAGWPGADISTLRDPHPHRRARAGSDAGHPALALHTLLPAQSSTSIVAFQLRHSHALARRVAAGQTALPPPVA